MNRARPIYWHLSQIALPADTLLVPQPNYEMRWTRNSAGRILEDNRPGDAIAHRDAVFMCREMQDCEDCGVEGEWFFSVIPQDRVSQHDAQWAQEITKLIANGFPPDGDEVKALARHYWAGEMTSHPAWEYLTSSALIDGVEPY